MANTINPPPGPQTYSFGVFRVVPSRRLLLRDSIAVHIGSRAFDLLVALAEEGGALVSRSMLIEKVWPGGFIDESALRVHISALRKALGEGDEGKQLIVNESGRGYRLAVSVIVEAEEVGETQHTLTALPSPIGYPIGRDEMMEALCRLVPEHHLVTLVGPGGIGKTTIALHVARHLESAYEWPPVFVDFGPVTDPKRVSATLATLLGLPVSGEDDSTAIVRKLWQRKQLFVFDNCEHLINPINSLVENILRYAAGVDILLTSREPLRAEGEWVQHLPPLTLPERDTEIDGVESAMQFSAIQLFVERARASQQNFVLDEKQIRLVVEIAQRLDGVPLALELAAARIGMFSLEGLAARLDNRFAVLTQGRRNAPPRHKTLKATVDWSYNLLDEGEKALLRSLSVFRGRFRLEDAAALQENTDTDVFESLAGLVQKSLVAAHSGSGDMSYRLPETTAVYAVEKLENAGESLAARQRHARWALALMRSAQYAILEGRFPAQRAFYASYLNDVRAAQSWSLGIDGDITLGTELTATSGALWFQLSLVTEYREMILRILELISEQSSKASSAHGLQLLMALGQAVWHTHGPGEDMLDAFRQALDQAYEADNLACQERAHWGLWNTHTLLGRYHDGLIHAELLQRLMSLADDSPIIDRLKSRSLNYLGAQNEAIQRARRLLHRSVDPNAGPVGPAHGLAFIEPVVARSVIARALWLQGLPKEALHEAQTCLNEMRVAGHAPSICYALCVAAIPVALWEGKRKLAHQWIDELHDLAENYGLVYWRSWSEVHRLIEVEHDQLWRDRIAKLGTMELEHLATWGVAETIPLLADRIDRDDGPWCTPELLRLQAIQLHTQGYLEEAVERLARAETLAKAHDARSWLERIANTRAQLRLLSSSRNRDISC